MLFATKIKWLKLASIFTGLFGLVLCFFHSSSALKWMIDAMDAVFIPDGSNIGFELYKGFMIGVTGAVMGGWGLMMYFLVTFGLSTKQKWAWTAMLVSILVWYATDSLISAAYGVYFNVALNSVFLVIFLLPILFLRKDMLGLKKEG